MILPHVWQNVSCFTASIGTIGPLCGPYARFNNDSCRDNSSRLAGMTSVLAVGCQPVARHQTFQTEACPYLTERDTDSSLLEAHEFFS